MSDLLSSDPLPSDAHRVPTIQLLCNGCQHAQTGRGGAKRPKQDLRSSSPLLLDIRLRAQPVQDWQNVIGAAAILRLGFPKKKELEGTLADHMSLQQLQK